jgi:hypothetical protein
MKKIYKPEEVLEAALKHYENSEYEASLRNYQWFLIIGVSRHLKKTNNDTKSNSN